MHIPDFHLHMSQSSISSPLLGALRRLRQLDSVACLRSAVALDECGWSIWDHPAAPSSSA